MCDSPWPHGLQHARPACPSPSPSDCPSSCALHWWCCPAISSSDSLFSAQSYLTLCHPMDSSVHGIFQARILRQVAIPFSRGSSQPRDWTQASCIAGRFFTVWATREAPFYSLWHPKALPAPNALEEKAIASFCTPSPRVSASHWALFLALIDAIG